MRAFVVLTFIVSVLGLTPARAQSNPEREFIMSCTYGVLAGTLVGAASLAFVDKPGDNLQRVARGASLGLYMGIGLGIYTVYILPGQIQREEEERLDPDKAAGEEASRRFQVFPFIAGNDVGHADGGGMGVVFSF